MASMRDVLVELSSGDVSGDERTNYEKQYNQFVAQIQTFIQDAGYNGKTLIGNITGSTGVYSRVAVARNEAGSSYGIATFSGTGLYTSIAFTSTQLGSATTVQALITTTGTFLNQQNALGEALNTVGSEINYVNNQVSYNTDKIDALNSGLGALVDADLAKESAQLTSLQIRQQLGTQALSLANSAPQTLLSLFK
jgi:flagellin